MTTEVTMIQVFKCEEPVDKPQGEVFRVEIWNRDKCVDLSHFGEAKDVIDLVSAYLEDLKAL